MRIVERYGAGMKVLAGKGPWALLTPARFLLAGLYGMWLRSRRGPKQADTVLRPEGNVRIVSIGNLQVGGGGKTPCTIALAEAIHEDGRNPVVVTRGYGSAAERAGLPVVLPGGREISRGDGYLREEEFCSGKPGRKLPQAELSRLLGDEVLAYRSRGIPVIIDPDRNRGIETAARLIGSCVILLDDAFQHRSAVRDLDILLLDAERPLAGGRLLPFGYLREKPGAVGRADAVIFTRALSSRIPEEAAQYVRDKPVFFAQHRGVDLLCRDGSTREPASLEGRRAVLFSGLAKPDSFEHLIAGTGANVSVSYRFPDHHVYDSGDIGGITAGSSPGTVFITTEKDWPKSAQLFDGAHDVMALRIRMEIKGLERLLALVTGAV